MPFAILQGMRIELSKQVGVMQALTAKLSDLGERARMVVKAHEHGKRAFDAAFEQDFAHLRMALRNLCAKMADFEHFAIRASKVLLRLPNVGDAANAAQTLLMVAKTLNIEVDNFNGLLSAHKNHFRKMESNIYWWDLEQSASELGRLLSQIILMVQS
ncbi:MAG TPA: hypothetical protein PLL10_00635, partial [Elusimicrobiales bacterium]|nr:hypothetical protein [Elusimicrobiales bacterium]